MECMISQMTRKSPRRIRRSREIAPDEVLIDSSNIPRFDTTQFEGRMERPITTFALYGVGAVFVMFMAIFIGQAWNLQVVQGEEYQERSERNMLRPVPVFAGRGVIMDRMGSLLAWNAPTDTDDASGIRREYATSSGLSHVLGYVQYPSKDKNGFYYRDDFQGVAGVEGYYDTDLKGTNGSRLVEIDARGSVVSEGVVRPPVRGSSLTLSIDSRVQSALYGFIRSVAQEVGFAGGAGAIMDVSTGELIALTSYPEYSSQVMSDRADADLVEQTLNDPDLPFLNRAVDGLYVPGSIVKPFVALAALTEDIIDASTNIVTTGSISIPNPYDPTKSTIFRDWKNHGTIDMRKALAVSSDAYFYTIGGGYKDQAGLGIVRIDEYLKAFGLGELMSESFAQGKAGTVPTPEWKKATFDEDWYLGNTYHTAIGQYGFQTTPVQIVRAIAAIANSGTLLVPTIIKDEAPHIERVISDISAADFNVVREGMRLGATQGTGVALNVGYVDVATKTGTAELGVTKERVNSWVTGFWPYQAPRYAFVVMLEKGSVHNLIGAAATMRRQLDWMHANTPEYF